MTTILIVDDNGQNIYLLQALLQGHGYTAVSAKDGEEALKIASCHSLDLVISDILMPVMDGFVLCRKWQADDRLKSIPFIFYTATYTDPKDMKFGLGLGAARFIVKPEEPDVLIATIKNVLAESQTADFSHVSLPQEEGGYLKEYNERLIHKLEKRTLDLEKEIAEREVAEKALRHAQKMEAIGTLASGIAHDFNNILTAIIGRSEIAKTLLHKPELVAEDLDIIISAGKRAAELVRQIHTFSRLEGGCLVPVAIQEVMDEVQELLATSIPKNIRVYKEVSTDCPLILGDFTQLLQVVMNLCTNAFQAIGESGGTLSIKLSEVEVTGSDSIPDCPQISPGLFLKLEVSDTGCGMDEKTVDNIFDPFFTTKEKTEGTGLGLSVVHGIVKRHAGEIAVRSIPGSGTTFHVYLPVEEEKSHSVTGEL